MKRFVLIGALLASASAVVPGHSADRAQEGRIGFSGAVVAATCVPRLSATRPDGGMQPLRCADPHLAADGRISSRRLDAGGAAGNPLLHYYLGEAAPAATAAAPRLVTIEYQ